MNHAKVYTILGIVGIVCSILLVFGVSKKRFRLFLPWICFQIFNICYQVYFSFEVFRFSRYEMLSFPSLVILMIFIFHTIFEGYYLCLIIGLSQIVVNIKVIESSDCNHPTTYRNIQMRSFHSAMSQSHQTGDETHQIYY